jgi:shikimate dehydrogenase
VSDMPGPDRYAVIGHPVAHSRSPFIHGEFARATGQPLAYGRIDAPPERFAAGLRAFFAGGGRGLNVTVPHKEAAAALVDALTPRAARAGAVNTILARADGTLLGDNTDGAGLVTDLERNLGVALAGRRILILGAGGATRGVLAPLLARSPARLAIANRTAERAARLAAAFADLGPVVGGAYGEVDGGRWDLVVNATSASLAGTVPPLAAGAVDGGTTCYDMAYAPGDTPFTRLARERGAGAAYMGWGMLVEQAAAAFRLWRGIEPPTAAVLARLRAGEG